MNLKSAGIVGGAGLLAAIGVAIKKFVDARKRNKIAKDQEKELETLVKQGQELTALIARNQEIAKKWDENLKENFEATLEMIEQIRKTTGTTEDIDIDPRTYDVTIDVI